MQEIDSALKILEEGKSMTEALKFLTEVNLGLLSPADQELVKSLEQKIKKEKEGANNPISIRHWNSHLLSLYNKAKPQISLKPIPPEKQTRVLNRHLPLNKTYAEPKFQFSPRG